MFTPVGYHPTSHDFTAVTGLYKVLRDAVNEKIVEVARVDDMRTLELLEAVFDSHLLIDVFFEGTQRGLDEEGRRRLSYALQPEAHRARVLLIGDCFARMTPTDRERINSRQEAFRVLTKVLRTILIDRNIPIGLEERLEEWQKLVHEVFSYGFRLAQHAQLVADDDD